MERKQPTEKATATAASDSTMHKVQPMVVDVRTSSDYTATERPTTGGERLRQSSGSNLLVAAGITVVDSEIRRPEVSSGCLTPPPLLYTMLITPAADQTTNPARKKEPYTINLGCGVLLEYDESDFCEPPSLNGLISTPARLLEAWDDEFSTGRCTSPLIVRGVSVPVKYWKVFYQNFIKKRWRLIKQSFLSYKVRSQS